MSAELSPVYGDPCLDKLWDGTPRACQAWWRGNKAGVVGVVQLVNAILDGGELVGKFHGPLIPDMVERLCLFRDQLYGFMVMQEPEEYVPLHNGTVICLPDLRDA